MSLTRVLGHKRVDVQKDTGLIERGGMRNSDCSHMPFVMCANARVVDDG